MKTAFMHNSSSILSYSLSLLLLLAHIGFFYLYAISLKGVLFSLLYFTLVVAVPGYCIFLLFFAFLSSKPEKEIDRYLMVSLSAVLGVANILFSYLLSQLTGIFLVNYLFVWPFLFIFLKSGKMVLVRSKDIFCNQQKQQSFWTWPIILLFTLAFNIYFFAMRPTPGIIPVEIFHDHLWNAGNTVSLMSGFPLQSVRIESMPFLSYHILIHILGAHMAFLTGLTPHLVGLQYVFIPFVPLLVYSMVALLKQFFKGGNGYLFYGLGVLLFGGGFHVVHDVKVLNLLGSTNFLGVILLFLFVTIAMHLQCFSNIGRFLLLFIGLFLATVAKGTIGIALCGGVGLWWLFRIYKRNLSWSDTVDALGASTGFLSSYYLFFIWPVLGQQFRNVVVDKGAFPVIPLGYVTNNELMSVLIHFINNYLSGLPLVAAHITLTLLVLPLYVLLYYSYRLLTIYYFRNYDIDEGKQRILIFALSSLLIGYMINVPYSQNYAYFITVAVFCLDVLFILYLQQVKAFSKIGELFRANDIFAFIGLIVILALPFVDIQNRIRHEHTHNYFFSGKIGSLLNKKLENTSYRKTRQYITPAMYDALSYIRQNTPQDTIIVSSLINTPDGRPRAFYVSTFSERTAFVEGYFQIRGLAKYADPVEVKDRINTVGEIYNKYEVPTSMQSSQYLFLCKVDEVEPFGKRHNLTVLYKNSEWAVIQFDQAPSS